MAQYRTQRVTEIIANSKELIKVRLDDESRAYCFPQLIGEVSVGDDVIINTTAIDLNLGTGGWHFILWNLNSKAVQTPSGGHIMKLRYTPLQIDTGVAEEFQDWNHEKNTIENMCVIAAPLHSHIPAIAAHLKLQNPELNISVVISDGASLPLALSDTIRTLKELELINSTITYGHAFGGDIEALNIFTALLSAKHKTNADVTIVSMGPGIVGTNSEFGFTGIEVAHHLDVAKSLGGQTFGVLRASSADPRDRHHGISHHAITTYSKATYSKHQLGLIDNHELSHKMRDQLKASSVIERHDIIERSSIGIVEKMESLGLEVSSMGRPARDDELFFEMAAVSAQLCLEELGRQ